MNSQNYSLIPRSITQELLKSADEYPVLTLLGPRQSGKTTVVRAVFPDKKYCSLEDPDIRSIAEIDPRGFLAEYPNGAIFDEIQRVPKLLSYIQTIVDEKKIKGMYILTGSHQTLLQESVAQSLAGRTAILTLLPFSLLELENTIDVNTDIFDYIANGSYPRIYADHLETNRFYNSYIKTYIERDVRSLINIKDLSLFQQFLVLMAGRVGQLSNYSALANDIGVSSTTIQNWVSVLKASHIIFELPPYFENLTKRVTKTSKLYFTDTGLAAHLLGILRGEVLARDPLRGGLFENFAILELLKFSYNNGINPDFYFYRDNHGHEVDLIIRNQGRLIPFEIKSAKTFNESFLKGIAHFNKKVTERSMGKGGIICNSEQIFSIKNVDIINLQKKNSIQSIWDMFNQPA